MCFATSLVALVAAGFGSLINYALAEAMAVGGMLAVSLFFLAMGLLHRNDLVDIGDMPRRWNEQNGDQPSDGKATLTSRPDTWADTGYEDKLDEDLREPLEAKA
jgi:hypothetical protein